MDNQHKMIKGYRDLSQAEIDLMNKIKAHGIATDALIVEVKAHVNAETRAALGAQDASAERIGYAEPLRWCAIAKTDFQTGFMALTRAVAQPTTF